MHDTNGPVTWKKSGAVGHVPAILVTRNASLDQDVEALSINKLCAFKRGDANEIYVAYFASVTFSFGQEWTWSSNLLKFVWEFEMSIFEVVLLVQTYPKGLDVLHFKILGYFVFGMYCIYFIRRIRNLNQCWHIGARYHSIDPKSITSLNGHWTGQPSKGRLKLLTDFESCYEPCETYWYEIRASEARLPKTWRKAWGKPSDDPKLIGREVWTAWLLCSPDSSWSKLGCRIIRKGWMLGFWNYRHKIPKQS